MRLEEPHASTVLHGEFVLPTRTEYVEMQQPGFGLGRCGASARHGIPADLAGLAFQLFRLFKFLQSGHRACRVVDALCGLRTSVAFGDRIMFSHYFLVSNTLPRRDRRRDEVQGVRSVEGL
jgi:hypothetical protein